MIIDNDEYEMKSIDKLHYTFLAGLSHDKWHTFNIEHDAAMSFESFVRCEFVVDRKLEATYAFRSQSNGKTHNSTTFRYTGESSGPVMSLVTTDQALHICQFHMAIMSGEARLSCCVRIRDTGSQIHITAATFPGI